MIYLIIKSYLAILMTVGLGAIALFSVGLFIIFRKQPVIQPTVSKSEVSSPVADVSAIAGDDMMATQLDLARAYLEIKQSSLAEQILQQVVAQGSAIQQQEAQQLLARL